MAVEILEVAFKAGRIGVYVNKSEIDITSEDYIIVEAQKGYDIGRTLQQGQLFYEEGLNEDLKNVVRKATEADLSKMKENRRLEEDAIRTCKQKIHAHKLNMNLVDAEYQLDHSKLSFYFTSEQRVDFRKLVRDLASQFRTRIELRQIGVRDAARHVSGYGACGCQLCCTTFIKKFENITTQYVKNQLIPMSPSRLTGICGRLKCCLAYENDFYLEELAKHPAVDSKVETPDGQGYVHKIDIFNSIIYVRFKSGDIEKYEADVLAGVTTDNG
ncbi:MAG: PSP1 domain-containing protein [Calditrichia bacterium]